MALVVLDFDGTLAETREAVSTTLNAALVAAELPRVHPPWIWSQMGLPLHTLVRKLVPPTIDADIDALVRWYRDRFDDLGAPHVRPIDDVPATLTALEHHGHTLAICTSRERSSLDPLLHRFGWTGRFAALGTCDLVDRGKPAPDLLQWVLDQVPHDDAVMVGDTTWDVQMAHAAGVTAVAIPTGSHSDERLASADPTVRLKQLSALPDWLVARRGSS